jgi:DUF1365 family protein
MTRVEYIAGETFHGRRGAIENAFRYAVDYVLFNPDDAQTPSLFSRNAGNLTSVWDSDHGGVPKHGRGVAWLREVLANHNLPGGDNVLLLAQPRVLGHVFNPVSFWLCHDAAGALRVVVAEVSNTFGDRHSYLCHRDDLAPITPQDRIAAHKILHVSPFQPVSGGYEFRFDINAERIGIWIDYTQGNGGLIATLTGQRTPLTNAAILRACLRRPFGSRRVLALIHWQALKLWIKRAPFFTRPEPPEEDVSK